MSCDGRMNCRDRHKITTNGEDPNMRKIAIALLATLVAALLGTVSSTPAQAQRPAAYTWTGFYIGGFVGAAHHKSTWNELDDDWWNGKQSSRSTGIYGGLLAGANYQVNSFLVGLEGDFGLASNSTKDNFSEGSYDD